MPESKREREVHALYFPHQHFYANDQPVYSVAAKEHFSNSFFFYFTSHCVVKLARRCEGEGGGARRSGWIHCSSREASAGVGVVYGVEG